MPLFGALCPDRMLGVLAATGQGKTVRNMQMMLTVRYMDERDQAGAIDCEGTTQPGACDLAMTMTDRWQDRWPRWKNERIDANRFVPLPRQRHTTMGYSSSGLADAGLRAGWYSSILHCWLGRQWHSGCTLLLPSINAGVCHITPHGAARGSQDQVEGSLPRTMWRPSRASKGETESKSETKALTGQSAKTPFTPHHSPTYLWPYIRQLDAYPHFDQQTGADGAESCRRAAHKPNPGMDFTGGNPIPKL